MCATLFPLANGPPSGRVTWVTTALGENRKFFNISDDVSRLLVMIVPETDQQVDPITYAPSLGREIENEYGREALEGLRTIGFKFEEPVG